MDKFKDDIEYYRTIHNTQHRLNPESWFIYGYILGSKSNSVFEFGCNVGRHLNQLQKLNIEVFGIDPVERFISEGIKKYDLKNIKVGDHENLTEIPDNSYDTCLTVSVLNHIHNIDEIIKHLKRICKNQIIICEADNMSSGKSPWYIHDYKLVGFNEIKKHKSNFTRSDALYKIYVWEK
jgi:SAM-dependent methyltransferase